MGKTRESVGYAEIGTYLHEDEGKAKVKTYTSANTPLKLEAHEKTRQLKKVRVETRVFEDKSVKEDGVYEKEYETIQTSDPKGNATGNNKTTSYDEGDDDEEETNDKSPLSKEGHFLKNMVDNLWADIRQMRESTVIMWVAIVLVGIIGAVALGFALS